MNISWGYSPKIEKYIPLGDFSPEKYLIIARQAIENLNVDAERKDNETKNKKEMDSVMIEINNAKEAANNRGERYWAY
jgi:hypothetical protein